jgi:hypothetical protein
VTQKQPALARRLIAYLAVYGCALGLVVGLIAAAFEEDIRVRVTGGLAAVAAVMIGNLIAKRTWPRKPLAGE